MTIFLSDFDKFSSYLVGVALIDDDEMQEILNVAYEEDVKDNSKQEESKVTVEVDNQSVTRNAERILVDVTMEKPLYNTNYIVKIEADSLHLTNIDHEERKQAGSPKKKLPETNMEEEVKSTETIKIVDIDEKARVPGLDNTRIKEGSLQS